MDSFAAIIDLWPSNQAFGEDVGVPKGTVAVWKHRNSVPAERWRLMVDAAVRRGIPGVTLERLADIAAAPAAPALEARVAAARSVA